MLRYLTAGESHGKALVAILEGMPANLELSVDDINPYPAERQKGYGRGGRQKIETDTVEILSGVRHGKTIGSPIALMIKNADFAHWETIMAAEPVSEPIETVTQIRPGHADLAGLLKYNQSDIRNILERSSARETAIRVAVGSVARKLLSTFGIQISSTILSVGGKTDEESIKQATDDARNAGVTLGGLIQIKADGLPIGLGSHARWDRKLDGQIAQALMSIQAIKSVEVGLGKEVAFRTGDQVHDPIAFEDDHFTHLSNNAGGIEGGMTNGEPVVLTIAMKPIPTMRTPLQSINYETLAPSPAHFERSDVEAVYACSVVAEAVTAITLANTFLEKFGGDSVGEIVS